MLTIGVVMNPWTKLFGVYCQQGLRDYAGVESLIAYFRTENELFFALNAGEIHVAPVSLKDFPTKLPAGIVIAALSHREQTANCLVIPKQFVDENEMLSLKKNARIFTHIDINTYQLRSFREDLQVETKHQVTPVEAINTLRTENFDAFVTTTATVKALNLQESEFKIITFSPKEFVTEPGQAIAAFLTAEDDLTTRRLLKKVHDPSVSMVTNIERKLKQLFDDQDIAAYCEMDTSHHFHVWAAAIIKGKLCRTRVSQSASFELAERCFEALHAQV